MLTLTRSIDASILIGNEITVIDIRGDKVRLGIEAHKNISIVRKEVYKRIGGDARGSAENRQ